MKLKIENNESMVRDTDSMAIINVNVKALSKDTIYKQKIIRESRIDGELNTLREDVDSIKSDLSQILTILKSRGH